MHSGKSHFREIKQPKYGSPKRLTRKPAFKLIFSWLTIIIIALFALDGRLLWAKFVSTKSENDSESSGITSLMTAVTNHDIESIKYLVKSASYEINKQNFGGATALHIACRNSDFEVTSLLVEAGADVTVADEEGWTPLMRAALAGNSEIISLLLSRGATIEKTNQYGETAVFHAASANCGKCVALLVRKFSMSSAIESPAIRSQMAQAYEMAVSNDNKEAQEAIAGFNNEVLKLIDFSAGMKTSSESDSENENTEIYETKETRKTMKNKGLVLKGLSKNRMPKKYKLTGKKTSKAEEQSSDNLIEAEASEASLVPPKSLKKPYPKTKKSSSAPRVKSKNEDEKSQNSEEETSNLRTPLPNAGTQDEEYLVDSFDIAPNPGNSSSNQSLNGQKKNFQLLQEQDFLKTNKAASSTKNSSESKLEGENSGSKNLVAKNSEEKFSPQNYSNSSNSILPSPRSQFKSFSNSPKKLFVFKAEESDANFGKDLSKEKISLPKKIKKPKKLLIKSDESSPDSVSYDDKGSKNLTTIKTKTENSSISGSQNPDNSAKNSSQNNNSSPNQSPIQAP